MGTKPIVDFSNLGPETNGWLTRFAYSLRTLGTLLEQYATHSRTMPMICHELQSRWPEDKRAGREQIVQLMNSMAHDAGFLATEARPELRQTFSEIALVLKRLYFAMNGEDTWQEDKFIEWLRLANMSDDEYFQQEAKHDEAGKATDTTDDHSGLDS